MTTLSKRSKYPPGQAPSAAQFATFERYRAANPQLHVKLLPAGTGSHICSIRVVQLPVDLWPRLDRDGYVIDWTDANWRRTGSPYDPPQDTLIGGPDAA